MVFIAACIFYMQLFLYILQIIFAIFTGNKSIRWIFLTKKLFCCKSLVFLLPRSDLLNERGSKITKREEGGGGMNVLPFEDDDLLNQFDCFCKKVLKYRNYSIFKSEEKEKRKGVIYVGENENLFDQVYIEDEYGILYFWLKIDGLTVAIENELLYRSLLLLPHKRLVILILSFFEGMTDKEISQEMLLPQSTVQYNRITALKRIRKLMEGMKDEP